MYKEAFLINLGEKDTTTLLYETIIKQLWHEPYPLIDILESVYEKCATLLIEKRKIRNIAVKLLRELINREWISRKGYFLLLTVKGREYVEGMVAA